MDTSAYLACLKTVVYLRTFWIAEETLRNLCGLGALAGVSFAEKLTKRYLVLA